MIDKTEMRKEVQAGTAVYAARRLSKCLKDALDEIDVLTAENEKLKYIILLNKVIPFNIIYVNLYQKQFFFKGQHGLTLSYTFKTDDIGKTVFLTREDAEKALVGRGESNE